MYIAVICIYVSVQRGGVGDDDGDSNADEDNGKREQEEKEITTNSLVYNLCHSLTIDTHFMLLCGHVDIGTKTAYVYLCGKRTCIKHTATWHNLTNV